MMLARVCPKWTLSHTVLVCGCTRPQNTTNACPRAGLGNTEKINSVIAGIPLGLTFSRCVCICSVYMCVQYEAVDTIVINIHVYLCGVFTFWCQLKHSLWLPSFPVAITSPC